MLATAGKGSDTNFERVTPNRLRVTRSDGLVVIYHAETPMGEVWDICYADNLGEEDIDELIGLEGKLITRYGRRLDELAVQRLENPWPHPDFLGSQMHTFVRICPKVALSV
ncbi:hypothetical protein ACFC1T_08390 [Kitasatospora sp. NPDC056076]|uniref:hypothetical protein n=1 Tax=Kitasatospora sp. NPDC056076 TaxID=3345703 RepID=UPI0035E1F4C9